MAVVPFEWIVNEKIACSEPQSGLAMKGLVYHLQMKETARNEYLLLKEKKKPNCFASSRSA